MTEKTIKYFLKNMGCQMNVADSNMVSSYLKSIGMMETDKIETADIVVINTCTVRQHAEERAFSEIGEMKHWKYAKTKIATSPCKSGRNHNDNNDIKILIVMGCVAERIGFDALKQKFPHIDIVIGAKSVPEFEKQLLNNKKFKSLIDKPGFFRSDFIGTQNDIITSNDNNSVSAFVTIMRGCNNYCSYCIVPYVRGKEISRNPAEIIEEIKCLVKRGIKEVTLLGQNVNSYKYKIPLYPPLQKGERRKTKKTYINFNELLQETTKIPGLLRTRFMTNHPKDVPGKVINTIASNPMICKHIHLPLQSGSDKILKKMNRKYTAKKYMSIIRKLQDKVPGIAITTDIMVGFPGETDRDFNDTVNLIKKIAPDFAYVFKYSTREKTTASKYKDNISKEIKEKRHKILLDLCNKIAERKNRKLINKKLEILVEKIYNDNNRFSLFGKTDDNRPVTCYLNKLPKQSIIGQIVTVKIINSKIHSLSGEVCQKIHSLR